MEPSGASLVSAAGVLPDPQFIIPPRLYTPRELPRSNRACCYRKGGSMWGGEPPPHANQSTLLVTHYSHNPLPKYTLPKMLLSKITWFYPLQHKMCSHFPKTHWSLLGFCIQLQDKDLWIKSVPLLIPARFCNPWSKEQAYPYTSILRKESKIRDILLKFTNIHIWQGRQCVDQQESCFCRSVWSFPPPS